MVGWLCAAAVGNLHDKQGVYVFIFELCMQACTFTLVRFSYMQH